MGRLKVIHPLLFALYPILFLYFNNIGEAHLSQIIFPMIIAATFCILLWVFLLIIFKDWEKSALITSTFFILFYLYGHFEHSISSFHLNFGPVHFGAFKLYSIISLIILGLAIYLIRMAHNFKNITYLLNIIGASLIVICIFTGLKNGNVFGKESDLGIGTELQVNYDPHKTYPDIYYIILDGYSRNDILSEIYHLDNHEFSQFLAKRGFYLADQSRSNYMQTFSSLASSLNFNYLNNLLGPIASESTDRNPIKYLIHHNKLFSFFKRYGYSITTFSSGYDLTEIKNVDFFMSSGFCLSNFDEMLIKYTPLEKFINTFFPGFKVSPLDKKIVYNFSHLGQLPPTKGPKFVFAHLIAPHPPFLFDRNGRRIETEPKSIRRKIPDLVKQGKVTSEQIAHYYREYVRFTNNQIEKAIDKILSKARRPVIIVLQADHGSGFCEEARFDNANYLAQRPPILNAYCFPDHNFKNLYKDISPVNSFRVILSQFFGQKLPLLEDRSFFSSYEMPFDFHEITRPSIQAH
jgi:hypothetical protein